MYSDWPLEILSDVHGEGWLWGQGWAGIDVVVLSRPGTLQPRVVTETLGGGGRSKKHIEKHGQVADGERRKRREEGRPGGCYRVTRVFGRRKLGSVLSEVWGA